ncbi:MAG TPA: hypothetical protein VGW75_11935 [Solirubrobacteraceae bacterium]|nr:hypothetical protein [Solirubrobacteraceae bacterium]
MGDYKRPGWAYRKLLTKQTEQMASAKPNRIGDVLEVVGKKDKSLWRKVDSVRGVEAALSCRQLEELVDRRNRIAHTGDRTRPREGSATSQGKSHFTSRTAGRSSRRSMR